MANEAAATVPSEVAEGKPAKSKKLLIIGAITALLLCCGGAAYFFLHKSHADEAKPAEAAAHKQPVYLPLETFTVNLRDADQERFLQVIINLEVTDNAVVDAFKKQMPAVRSHILLLLTSKTSAELVPREGKEKLSAEIATDLRALLEGPDAGKGLGQVLFTHFVIQ